MEAEHTTGEGDRPQWLGSLVRRGDEAATHADETPFDAGAAQWLGSVARRNDGSGDQAGSDLGAGWTGSPVRSAVFLASQTEASPSPVRAPAPPASLHELTGRGR